MVHSIPNTAKSGELQFQTCYLYSKTTHLGGLKLQPVCLSATFAVQNQQVQPSSNQAIFETRLSKGGCCNILPRFSPKNPLCINRQVLISSIHTYKNEYNWPRRYVVFFREKQAKMQNFAMKVRIKQITYMPQSLSQRLRVTGEKCKGVPTTPPPLVIRGISFLA